MFVVGWLLYFILYSIWSTVVYVTPTQKPEEFFSFMSPLCLLFIVVLLQVIIYYVMIILATVNYISNGFFPLIWLSAATFKVEQKKNC